MTGNCDGPVPPNLPVSECWVDAASSDPNRDAILCMNTSQSWESWLLPLVYIINLATQIQPTDPYLVPYGDGGCSCSDGVYSGDMHDLSGL